MRRSGVPLRLRSRPLQTSLRALSVLGVQTLLLALCGAPACSADRPVRLLFTGDLLLAGRAQAIIARGGPSAPTVGVVGLLRGADIAVGNLECPLSARGEAVDKAYTYRGRPEAAAVLRVSGFDVVSLANNHTGDFGGGALVDTIDACGDHGVLTVGAGRTLAEARRPVFHSAGRPRRTVAFLGYSNMYPKEFWATRSRPGTNPAYVAHLKADVAAAAKQADLVVVLFHFGDELSDTPTRAQRLLAHTAVDAGADLVVGHHPHVVQGLERYGDGLIAYSLGNFVFPSHRRETRQTALLEYTLPPDGPPEARLIPCTITGAKPFLAKPKARTAILARVRKLSKALKTEIGSDGGVGR